jgi:hypothetical protein
MKKFLCLAVGMLAVSSCSSLIEGTSQEIMVTTTPLGASCSFWRDGAVIAKVPTTPAVVTVSRVHSDIVVTCNKPGYREATYLNRAEISGAVAGNVLNAGLGWGIDSMVGADNKYDRTVALALEPITMGDQSAASLPGAKLGDLAGPEDTALITRFQTLRRLLDEGLITRDEYNRRRGANLGALLRYTVASPAADLERPAPDAQQLVDRLHYLAKAFEEKGISAQEQSVERSIILDALLPAVPTRRAGPPPPLTDQLQAAAATGRLERFALARIITSDEQTREKAEIFRKVQVAMADSEAAARAAAGMPASMPMPPSLPTGPGVWLGSYRTENQARLAWASLQLTHPTELGNLQMEVKRVALRRRGVTFHLNAGSLADRRAAESLCRALRSKRQFCRPTVLGK